MRDAVATHRYLTRHIEAGLPEPPLTAVPWAHVLVIPAYNESPDLLQHLDTVSAGDQRCLIILVLNHPDSQSNAAVNAAENATDNGSPNEPLRSAITQRYTKSTDIPHAGIYNVSENTDLCLLNVDALRGPLPAAQGVGLARKIGCDLAFKWIASGAIASQWIHCSDADAELPENYFAQTSNQPEGTSAAVYPFAHRPGEDANTNRATAFYELRMLHYVLGLEYAKSPYAYHTLGSCLAVNASAYAHARGFGRRSGAEDFYLLNKLAKLGSIARLRGDCIQLASRDSSRVPFGTGPAVKLLAEQSNVESMPYFYHPEGFTVLKQALRSFSAVANDPAIPFATLLENEGVETARATTAQQALDALGWGQVLDHCRRQSRDQAQFTRSLHQWFDGFRTLKFLHTLRAAGLDSLSLEQLQACEPSLWPTENTLYETHPNTIETLRGAIRSHWGWNA